MNISIGAAVIYDRSHNVFRVGIFSGIMPNADLRIIPFNGAELGSLTDIRSGDQVIAVSDVLPKIEPFTAEDLFGPSRVFARGEVVLEESGSGSWKAFCAAHEVLLPFGERLTDVAIEVFEWLPIVGHYGTPLIKPAAVLQNLSYVSRNAEFKYGAPKDEMFGVLAESLLETWNSGESKILAVFPKESFNGIGQVELIDNQINVVLRYDLVDRFGPDPYPISDKQVYGSKGTLRPLNGGNWRAEQVFLHPTADFAKLTGKAYRLSVCFNDAAVTETTRETYAGGRFESFSDRVFGPNPDPIEILAGPQAFRVNVFGRNA